MHILFLNRSFYPDMEATGQLLTELCEQLSKEHFITVIAGKSYHVPCKGGLLPIIRENYKSIEIIRVRGTTLPKRILLFRIVNLLSYFILAFISGFLTKNPTVIVAQTDPPILGLLGIFFSKLYRAKFIYYCKDLYPDVGVITGKIKSKLIALFLEWVNLYSFIKADKVVCIGEDMKKRIIDKGVNESKVRVIHDWVDTDEIYPIPRINKFRLKYGLDEQFLIIYSGNIGFSQDLDKIIQTAYSFRDRKDILFLLIGEGSNKPYLQKLVKKLGISNVIFLPYQDKRDLKYSLTAADLHLIPLHKGLAGIIVPSKLYGILAAGRPFLASIDEDSEVSLIARKFNCGIVVEPGDINGMVSAILWGVENRDKLEEMGSNARRVACTYFTRDIAVKKFSNIIYD